MSAEARLTMKRLYADTDRLTQEAEALLAADDPAGAEKMCLRAAAAAPWIGGRKQVRSTLPLLLADIYLEEGRYAEALPIYLQSKTTVIRSTGVDLEIALCYIRLGNYTMARQFYSPQMILQYEPIVKRDLPPIDTMHGLEANVLFARGVNAFFHSQTKDTLSNLSAAIALAPRNGAIAYFLGKTMDFQNRFADAEPYLRKAAQYAQPSIARLARQRLGLGDRPSTDDVSKKPEVN